MIHGIMPDLPPPIPPPPYSHAYPAYPGVYPPRDQRKTDSDHLRLLLIFSYVSAGLAVLGIGFLYLHYNMMSMVASHTELFEHAHPVSQPNPALIFQQMLGAFRWFYVVFGLWGVAMAILNVVAGYLLGQRRHRTFCLIVAGLNCLRVPLGTALGIFTLMVLTRDSVRTLYADESGTAPAALDKPLS